MRAILINPRYTGYEIWNKQRKEERLLDVDDVTLGHTTRMTHNPAEEWIRSNEPAHEAIISPSRFDTVQALRRQRARNQGRQERVGKQGARPYALRGRVRCSLCGRKMQPATIRNHVYYRCEFKDQEAALYPELTHPRTINLREDIICHALDPWIARAFAPDRLSATIEALTLASAAASTAETTHPSRFKRTRRSRTASDVSPATKQPSKPEPTQPSSPSGSTTHSETRKRRRRSSTRSPPSPERRNPHSTRNRSVRSRRVSETLHGASARPAPTRRAHSTKP
ncbi:recombinase family protein [Streptomyces sp. NPDC004533]|uniref:recombinase family protein n=1 Tax=Streptomyces sp. NPDC004533 TaxID=3154278 RepID=UPI0033AD279D